MSKLTALLDELCPDGVEYRSLGEVIVLHPGVRITRKNDSGTLYPVYGGGGESFRTDNFNRTNDYVISRFAMSENCVRYVPGEFWLLDSGISFEATPTVLKEYIGHNLMQMQPQIFQCSGKSAQRNLRVKDFLTLTLPVPPLEVQQEIVRVLDAFTDLERSLVSELELRKKQLAVLHDGLLEEVADESELLSLESVCSQILAGGDKPKDCVKSQRSPSEERPFPVFSNGTGRDALYGYSSECRVHMEAVTIAARGSVGHHAVRAAGFTPIIRLIVLIPDAEVISAKYLNYALDTLPIDGTSGGISQLTVPMVKKLFIPVPPLEVQQKIVAKLDTFEALIQSLEQEISLRRQQYEFYRDELLSFTPKED